MTRLTAKIGPPTIPVERERTRASHGNGAAASKGRRRPRTGAIIFVVALSVAGLAGLGIAVAEASLLSGANGTLWVTDRVGRAGELGGLFAIDAGTGEVTKGIDVGASPIGAVAPRSTGKVYTSNEAEGSVSVVSQHSLSEVKRIPTGAGSKQHHLMESPNGRFIYVAHFGMRHVAVIDTRSDELSETLQMSTRPGTKDACGLISADGATLHATNNFTPSSVPAPPLPGTLSALDLRSRTLLWESRSA